jgi:hypothetical protein
MLITKYDSHCYPPDGCRVRPIPGHRLARTVPGAAMSHPPVKLAELSLPHPRRKWIATERPLSAPEPDMNAR